MQAHSNPDREIPVIPVSPQSNDPRPTAPARPGNDECCNSGCNPCIFDLYQDELEAYRAALREWEERQAARRKEPGA